MARPPRNVKPVLPDYSEGVQIKTEDEDPRFNDALARGLAVLRSFNLESQLLGNVELAQLTGLAKSTVSRLTFTLTQLGYLRYREQLGKYELAVGVVGLAYPYLANLTAPTVARPLMAELARATRTNVGMGAQEGLSVFYLEYSLGQTNPNWRQRAGYRVPLVRTAMGRACIAGMTEEARSQLYDDLRQYYSAEWETLRKQLDLAVRQVQTTGYCIAANTFRQGVSAVAVPFVEADGRSNMAFNSQGVESTQSQAVLARNGKKLLDLCRQVHLLTA